MNEDSYKYRYRRDMFIGSQVWNQFRVTKFITDYNCKRNLKINVIDNIQLFL